MFSASWEERFVSLRSQCISMNEVTDEHVGHPLNDLLTLPYFTNKIPCLKFNTWRSPEILVSGSVSKGEPAISATIFSTNNQCRWNWGRGPRTFGTDKGALFLSTNEIQLVYSCAVFLTVSQVTKQNETFCGHYHGVKNSDHPWVLKRWPTICFLDSIFWPIYHHTARQTDKFPL